MAKLSAKKIRERQLKSKIIQFTPKTFTAHMLNTLNEDHRLSFLIGQAIYVVLKPLEECDYVNALEFENFVRKSCELVRLSIHDLEDEDNELPTNLITYCTMTILVHGDLIKGITFPILPIVKGKNVTYDLKTSSEEVEITEEGKTFLSKVNSGSCLFTEQINDENAIFDSVYTTLAIDYMQKIAGKFQDQ